MSSNEPQLITSDPNLSSMVETGQDPLSQLAATTSLPKDEISNKRTPNSIGDHNLLNQSDLLNSDGITCGAVWVVLERGRPSEHQELCDGPSGQETTSSPQ